MTRKKRKKTNGKKWERKPLPKLAILTLYPMRDVLRRRIEEMGGEEIKLAIQKQLSYTDLDKDNSRLSIHRGQIKSTFLSKEEETRLDKYEGNSKRKVGLDVLVMDPWLEEMELMLKKWVMDKSGVFNMIHSWIQLVEKNGLGLEAGDTIQLWSFRIEHRRIMIGTSLCFALVKLVEEGGGVNNGDPQADVAGAGADAVIIQEQHGERVEDMVFIL